MSIIKSFSVGNGDMFYINHNSDNFSIIDSCMDDSNKVRIVSEIQRERSGKGITRFISTHPDEDHLQGLKYLDDRLAILNFYCVENRAKVYEYAKENPLWTAAVSLHKKEAGVETPLVGTFELCERMADGTVKVLETGTTDAEGKLSFTRKIVYTDGVCNKSTYFIREKEAPAGYVLDTNEYPVSCTENEQKISVTIENAPILGSLELRKQSSIGKPMQGVEFLLEYSLDNGSTWNVVTYRENDSIIIPGSCTNAELADGKLLTDENGIAVYEGLRVYKADGTVILYRVTETKTLNGSSLMPGHIWEGDLVTEKEGEHQFEVVLGVVNSPILELPETGSKSLAFMPIGLLLCAAVCLGALLVLKKKKEV